MRRAARALGVAVAVAVAGCAGAPGRGDRAAGIPLKVSPASDLVTAAGLAWLVEVKPRALIGDVRLEDAVRAVLPAARLDALAARDGVDLRRVDDLVVAGVGDARLAIVVGELDPGVVERAFAARLLVEGRTIDREPGGAATAHEPITRLWGADHGEKQEIAILGRRAVALESGRGGALRAAEAFALERLRRAAPALRVPPLADVDGALGPAPARIFVPGPFTGDAARGLAGLLASATAVGVALHPTDLVNGRAGVRARLAVLGVGASHAEDAARRLEIAVERLGTTAAGRLAGLDRPRSPPRATRASSGALAVEMEVDAIDLARGIHAALGASIREAMAY